MIATLKALLSIFGPTGRRRLVVLSVAMIGTAILESASIAMVFPFIQLTLDPAAANTALIKNVIAAVGMTGRASPVIVIGWLALILFLGATGLSAMTAWFMFRMAGSENRRLSVRLLRGYVHQPYRFFLDRNTSTLAKNVLAEVDMLADNVLIPLGYLVGRVVLVLSIGGVLFLANPTVALSVVGVVGILYGGLYYLLHDPMGKRGTRRVTANSERYRAAQEVLGGIKEIKVLGREGYFLDAYAGAARSYTKVIAQAQIAGSIPKYFLEGVGIGGILALLLVFARDGQSNADVVPMLALYAAAAYRVMPGLQQIYTGITNLRFCASRIWLLRNELAGLEESEAVPQPGANGDVARFSRELELDEVTFRYSGAESATLDRVSMSVPKNSCVAVVGQTGSGKTTLIDVLLGLHSPQSGNIILDGLALDPKRIRSWQRNIGYVPQTIYLSDSSIRSNIAFGIDESAIDDGAVVRAAQLAGVHDFIVSDTPAGYETVVGDRGVRLSGGQRQRIGIARALYANPEVLILDEATSSLDYRTEEAVMNAIRALSQSKTIIIVAHRLTTVQDCDCIFVLRKGRICEQGTYQQLISKGGVFATMARTYSGAVEQRA